MEENWDDDDSGTVASGLKPAVNFETAMAKPRGFGRGNPLTSNMNALNIDESKHHSNGFGSKTGIGFENLIFGEKDSNNDDAWNEDDSMGFVKTRDSRGTGGFGGYSGGFGSGRGGRFGTSDDAPRGGRFPKKDGPGGSGGGSGCRKCGEEGHFARDCPSGDNRGFGCHKCGEEGHMARDCPNNRGGGGARSSGCRKCGEDGHFARDCPNGGDSAGDAGGSGCRKCGQEGHFARDCPSGGSGGGGSGCRKCGEDGHFARDCPNGGSGGGSGCRKCGEEGHFARDCPNAGGDASSGGTGCRKCGEEGHFARECPNSGSGDKPKENYIPPELPEDETSVFQPSIQKGINFDKYDNIAVEVTGNNRVLPISSFEEAELLPTFLRNVKRANYTKPTPIQKNAIPAILAGRDLMGCAQTGSGKTAAFILPVLTAMVRNGLTTGKLSEVQEPQAVVIAPTRELVLQIYGEARKFAFGTDVRPVVVYGGTSVGHQLRQVEQGANLVVGTPGRLLDFVTKGKISLRKVEFLVLDEADRMLDMGFEPDVRKIVETFGMPPKGKRQTLMFSATFKEEIQKLAADFLNNYLFITVGIVGGACSDVEQTFFEVDRLKKREHLCDILNNSGSDKVLVFVGQKRNADFLASYLSQSGFPATSIHGDRLQREREEALHDFKTGKLPILIATNVAARGLDIPEVKHVVNYDLPSEIDEYVHRIGRTGRCGNLGKSTSFYSHDADSSLAANLVRILKESRQEVPEWLQAYAAGEISDFSSISQFGGKDIRRQRGEKYGGGGGNSFRGRDMDSGFGNAGMDADLGYGVGGDGDEESWD